MKIKITSFKTRAVNGLRQVLSYFPGGWSAKFRLASGSCLLINHSQMKYRKTKSIWMATLRHMRYDFSNPEKASNLASVAAKWSQINTKRTWHSNNSN